MGFALRYVTGKRTIPVRTAPTLFDSKRRASNGEPRERGGAPLRRPASSVLWNHPCLCESMLDSQVMNLGPLRVFLSSVRPKCVSENVGECARPRCHRTSVARSAGPNCAFSSLFTGLASSRRSLRW